MAGAGFVFALQALILGAAAVLVQVARMEAVPVEPLIGLHMARISPVQAAHGSTNGLRFLLVHDVVAVNAPDQRPGVWRFGL
jgi:hypothetical protein